MLINMKSFQYIENMNEPQKHKDRLAIEATCRQGDISRVDCSVASESQPFNGSWNSVYFSLFVLFLITKPRLLILKSTRS